jgi:Alginate lyase
MLTRRSLLFSLASLPLAAQRERATGLDLRSIERSRVLRAADRYLREQPITITASRSARSSGGLHDYFSEGDYWWPDPATPDGPYIQKDGMTNPDNFVDHRHALMRLSVQMPSLTAAWVLTGEKRYASHAVRHLRAWFLDERTLMNPHLLYAQAIKGRFTGRGIGIIDTLHLVEVVRAVAALERSDAFERAERDGVRAWFDRYLTWMTTHEYGQTERDAKNNHGTCWVLQVAELARHTGRHDLTAFCRQRYKTVIVPGQIGADGSFPEELRRTKPYGYSLFNLDAMAGICQVLSSGDDNLWTFALPDGRGIARALEFLVPFIADKPAWKHPPDVMYFDEWPVRHCLLLFGGLALGRRDYLDLWLKLNPDPTVTEVVRNFFIRQPLLWVSA